MKMERRRPGGMGKGGGYLVFSSSTDNALPPIHAAPLKLDENYLLSHFLLMHRHCPHHFNHTNSSMIVFVTICTHQRKPILTNSTVHFELHHLWKKSKNWCVGNYMIMPDHLHFFVKSRGSSSESLGNWIGYWKRDFLHKISFNDSTLFWQKDFWDRTLRQSESYKAKWLYVQENPVRAHLVKKSGDWPYQGMVYPLMQE